MKFEYRWFVNSTKVFPNVLKSLLKAAFVAIVQRCSEHNRKLLNLNGVITRVKLYSLGCHVLLVALASVNAHILLLTKYKSLERSATVCFHLNDFFSHTGHSGV